MMLMLEFEVVVIVVVAGSMRISFGEFLETIASWDYCVDYDNRPEDASYSLNACRSSALDKRVEAVDELSSLSYSAVSHYAFDHFRTSCILAVEECSFDAYYLALVVVVMSQTMDRMDLVDVADVHRQF